MLAAAIELLGADMGNVQMLNADRSALVIAAQRGFEHDFLDFFCEVSTEDDTAAAGRCAPASEPLSKMLRPTVARVAGYRAVQSTPLSGRERVPLGMSRRIGDWCISEQDLRRLDLYARQAADFIERCRTDEALRESEDSLRLAMRVSRMFVWTWTCARAQSSNPMGAPR